MQRLVLVLLLACLPVLLHGTKTGLDQLRNTKEEMLRQKVQSLDQYRDLQGHDCVFWATTTRSLPTLPSSPSWRRAAFSASIQSPATGLSRTKPRFLFFSFSHLFFSLCNFSSHTLLSVFQSWPLVAGIYWWSSIQGTNPPSVFA